VADTPYVYRVRAELVVAFPLATATVRRFQPDASGQFGGYKHGRPAFSTATRFVRNSQLDSLGGEPTAYHIERSVDGINFDAFVDVISLNVDDIHGCNAVAGLHIYLSRSRRAQRFLLRLQRIHTGYPDCARRQQT